MNHKEQIATQLKEKRPQSGYCGFYNRIINRIIDFILSLVAAVAVTPIVFIIGIFKCCLHIGFRACLRHPQPTWTADESFSFLLCVPMIRTQWRIGMGSRYLQPKFFKRHGSLRPNAAWCICAFNKVCCNELKCGMPFRHQNAQNTTILMIHYTMIDGELQEFWLKGVCKSVTNH